MERLRAWRSVLRLASAPLDYRWPGEFDEVRQTVEPWQIAQGLKPVFLVVRSARLKSCPDARHFAVENIQDAE